MLSSRCRRMLLRSTAVSEQPVRPAEFVPGHPLLDHRADPRGAHQTHMSTTRHGPGRQHQALAVARRRPGRRRRTASRRCVRRPTADQPRRGPRVPPLPGIGHSSMRTGRTESFAHHVTSGGDHQPDRLAAGILSACPQRSRLDGAWSYADEAGPPPGPSATASPVRTGQLIGEPFRRVADERPW